MINPRDTEKNEILFGQGNYNWVRETTDEFTLPMGENENIMILELVPFRSEIWAARFPRLARLRYDLSNLSPYVDDPDWPFNPSYNELYGNTIISTRRSIDAGSLVRIDEMAMKFATRIEWPEILTTDENPIFVNPTIGDYRIVEGSGYEDIPYELIGRY